MKYQYIRQHSQEDCGAACLASISKYYGKTITLNRSREAVGTGQQGTTLLGLKRGAEILGFNARTVRTSPEILKRIDEVPLPAIIHWKGYHWIVLYGKKKNKYIVADPAVGIRYLSEQELVFGWLDWMMLLLEPNSASFSDRQEERQQGFKRFLQRVTSYKGILFQALAINLVLGVLSLASPFLLQILTDDVLVRGDSKLLNNVAIAVILMTLISTVLGLIQSNLIANFAKRLELGLVLDFAKKLLRLPLAYYEARRSGEIISRLGDIQEINQLISQVVVSLPSQFFVAIISLSLMFFYSWQLSLVAIIISVAMTLSTIVFLPNLQQKTRSLLVTDAENQGVLVETFKGALTLKTITATNQVRDELQGRFCRLANLSLRTIQIGIINSNFSNLVSGVGGIILLWFGGKLVIDPVNNLSIGQLLAFKAMNDNFVIFIGTVVGFIDEFTRATTATQRLGEVIDATPETNEQTHKPWVKIAERTDIICDRLSFHHSGRVELLANFNLTIPGGTVIALIGKSGCGKSTLAKLIAGLYQSQSGNIRFGIYNQQDLSLDCLRQQVMLVPQEAHFWSRSILDNFRLANPEVTFDEIVKACRITGADEFISKFPDKYQTILGEFGSNLSGGQKQKLAIARAIINNPPILILDESTAALDPISETEVLNSLLSYRQGKTTILISHRPQVIKRAEKIIMLDRGKLKIQGSQEYLRNKVGQHLNFLVNC